MKSSETGLRTWLLVLFLVYCILLAVTTIGSGFSWLAGGKEGAKELFAFATNPFMGLLVGTLGTALVQSSSTVTSVTVALCAGGLPVSIAIPIVMGANIGTTITNTIVSLGHIRSKEEFKSAFAAATIHDFFNWLSVVIFLPLEIAFGFLEKSSVFLATLIMGGSSMNIKGLDFIKPITKPIVHGLQDTLSGLPHPLGAIVLIAAGVVIIFFAIFYLGKMLRKVMTGKAKAILHRAIGRGPVTGIASGTLMTVLVQSSSTTTSLIVPLAGTGVLKLKEIYPFTLGANIGTCITALLAATAVTGPTAILALEVALSHLLYNLIGVVVIYGIPFLRVIPIMCAEYLANIGSHRKVYALGYVLAIFFLLPGIFVGIYSAM